MAAMNGREEWTLPAAGAIITRMKYWQRAALVFSAAWVLVLGIYVTVSAYQKFACVPTVDTLPDGTIVRHACLHGATPWRVIVLTAGYFAGGVAVIWVLSWLFLGWPSDVVSNYFGFRRDRK
jgi:hypothetical protein